MDVPSNENMEQTQTQMPKYLRGGVGPQSQGLLLEFCKGVSLCWRVDGTNHSLRAMASLSAIEPDRAPVCDCHDEAREIGCIRGRGMKSGIEATGQGTTRASEGSLSDGMVLLMELEDDVVSNSSVDDRRGVHQVGGSVALCPSYNYEMSSWLSPGGCRGCC